MKRLLTLVLCTASLMAALSCVKDRPKDSTIKAKSYNYFNAVASSASLTADAGIVTLDITANVPWTIKADEGLTLQSASPWGRIPLFPGAAFPILFPPKRNWTWTILNSGRFSAVPWTSA